MSRPAVAVAPLVLGLTGGVMAQAVAASARAQRPTDAERAAVLAGTAAALAIASASLLVLALSGTAAES